jgi:hypothetical protein
MMATLPCCCCRDPIVMLLLPSCRGRSNPVSSLVTLGTGGNQNPGPAPGEGSADSLRIYPTSHHLPCSWPFRGSEPLDGPPRTPSPANVGRSQGPGGECDVPGCICLPLSPPFSSRTCPALSQAKMKPLVPVNPLPTAARRSQPALELPADPSPKFTFSFSIVSVPGRSSLASAHHRSVLAAAHCR